jgi:hypothetical protein
MYEALCIYQEQRKAAESSGKPPPRLPEYLGQCFLLIAQRLSTKPNFYNYSFRDEMISDGVENAVLMAHNFNVEKYNNPHAYFTTMIFRAYIRRIKREKRMHDQDTLHQYARMQILNASATGTNYIQLHNYDKTIRTELAEPQLTSTSKPEKVARSSKIFE